MPYPKDFIWGVATAAAQIEGGARDGGRGPSIWDAYAAAGKIKNNDTPSVACDSYHRFETDLANLKALGVNSYRLSIAWPRVMPSGTGALNPAGLAYYRRVFESLLEAGIAPNVTLYHWDLPQALEERGGWLSPDSGKWFADYADAMFRQYGDIVPMWVTINEPIAVYVGYGLGWFAPGYKDIARGNQARHNVLTAHGRAVEAFRASDAVGKIGIVIDIWKRHPATDSEADAAMVIDQDEDNWKFYTDRVFAGRYSDYLLKKLGREGTLMTIGPDDLRLGAVPLDFYGLNCYNRVVVSAEKEDKRDPGTGGNPHLEPQFYDRVIYDAVHLLRGLYNLQLPIYVTENGTFFGAEEVPDERGIVQDRYRQRYLAAMLESVEMLLKEGIDLRGYYLWSLMDNFEWTAGYSVRYGILRTDFTTLARTWKASAYWYRDYIRRASGREAANA
ncbi:MAG: family 1 glycosylhydrolase [Chloroflexi bacterium]|nr:family 1 glycosylhydrolase [Chloroflexota bacterium]